MERLPVLPELLITKELAIAAGEYAELEDVYFGCMQSLIDDLPQTPGEVLQVRTKLGFALKRMKDLEKGFELLIGGEDRTHKAGRYVLFEAATQNIYDGANIEMLHKRRLAVIRISEISAKIGDNVVRVRKPEVVEPGFIGY